MNQETISIAEAKRTFSELLGKVAYGKKRIVITKRGKPMALLSPSEEADATTFQCQGWVNESDPFFSAVDRIVQERAAHRPRVLRGGVIDLLPALFKEIAVPEDCRPNELRGSIGSGAARCG